MSKAALDTLTVGLAAEVAGDGIRVNGVRPGLIATDMNAAPEHRGRLERLLATVPMGRPGTADEVAEAIRWLASDAAGYVTGVTLDVSGGR
jgi:NAD(P)-dependent dehydrogenase (short-subunit alcohol dehydrogenase family)